MLKNEKANLIVKGAREGLPIGLGYLGVSFAFGVLCVKEGLSVWQATLISLANLTSAGQFAGLGIVAAGGPLAEMALSQLVINLRYSLMSFSLAQKLEPGVPLYRRLLVAFGVTDEIYAISVAQPGTLSPFYSYGAILSGITGWGLGTFLGALSGSVLPAFALRALGVALYAMFIAIILPPAQQDPVLWKIVLGAAALSSLFRFWPLLAGVSSGFAVIVCTVAAAGLAAAFFPMPGEETEAA